MYSEPRRKTLSAAIVADRYRLEREIAQGGMGTVWLGIDTKLGRSVAVKVMAQELAQMSEAQARFNREALAVAQLHSTHVVQVYDYGVQEGLPYIVMELLEGESLGMRLKRLNRLSLSATLPIVVQIGKGLKTAHAAGLIHRDLKPSNIFIAQRDDEEVIKLLDFGVVKALDNLGPTQEATSTGMLLGTPQYMSPEQARGIRSLDHRSDLWSFGVIIFRMLTGTNPFKGDNVGDVVLRICSDALPSIADQAPDLPPELDRFFERAFTRSPKGRFQSAVELVDAFFNIAATVMSHPSAMMSLSSDSFPSLITRIPSMPLPPPRMPPPPRHSRPSSEALSDPTGPPHPESAPIGPPTGPPHPESASIGPPHPESAPIGPPTGPPHPESASIGPPPESAPIGPPTGPPHPESASIGPPHPESASIGSPPPSVRDPVASAVAPSLAPELPPMSPSQFPMAQLPPAALAGSTIPTPVSAISFYGAAATDPPTPNSTTVGGMQIAFSTRRRFNMAALAPIAGGLVVLFVVGMLSLLWLSSGRSESAASTPATPPKVESVMTSDSPDPGDDEEEDQSERAPDSGAPADSNSRLETKPRYSVPPALPAKQREKDKDKRPKWF